MKFLDVKEFEEGGYLQEVNRLVLHPVGLCLQVTGDALCVLDARDDPEGFVYLHGYTEERRKKRDRVVKEMLAKGDARRQLMGQSIQPIDS